MALCVFNPETLRCERCGWAAARLPTYRECRTVLELARERVTNQATRRIRIPSPKIGTAIGNVFSAVGITPERVSRLSGGKPCGCKQRAQALDDAGEFLKTIVERGLNAAANAILPHPAGDGEVADMAMRIVNGKNTNEGLVLRAAQEQLVNKVGNG
jgi:hypothetical protein